MYSYKKEPDYVIWKTGMGIVLAALFFVFLVEVTPLSWKSFLFECWVRKSSGLYCPGCGGTRALLCLLQGDWMGSILYHPAVIYTFFVLACYLFRGLLCVVSHGKLPFMRFRAVYVYIGLGITLLQFAAKNILLLCFHIQWIA
ncbi:MAG: DUF2752 domain-containing protein [Clostridiaceae bacterium]|nr:DUF2752 domain-containing protein [Clostridiaceae bacterium]